MTWAFLAEHIAHEPTIPSQTFSQSPPATQESHQGRHSRSASPGGGTSSSGLSAASLQRRRRLKEQKKRVLVSSEREEEQTFAGQAIKQLLEQANLLQKPEKLTEHEQNIQHFAGYLRTKLRRVAPCNFPMLSQKLLEMTTAMEEPVAGETALVDPRRVLESYMVAAAGIAAAPPPQQPPPPPPPMWQPMPSTSGMPPPPLVPVYPQQQQQPP